MNRRTFLQAIGLAIAAPGAVLGAVKATPAKIPVLLAPTTIEALWAQELFDYALKNVRLTAFIVGDQWAPPMGISNLQAQQNRRMSECLNRIRPK